MAMHEPLMKRRGTDPMADVCHKRGQEDWSGAWVAMGQCASRKANMPLEANGFPGIPWESQGF